MKTAKVLLFAPPFYRFCGSHNDRVSLSLSYLSAHLENAEVEHLVFNADFTGAEKFRSIESLFDDYDSFVDAVDDKGGHYGEVIEQIVSFEPDVVVILGADPLVPTKDLGSPYIGANFSKRLRKLGIYTVGFGPYYNMEPEKFEKDFDALFLGLPSSKIVEVVNTKPKGRIASGDFCPETIPSFDHLYPKGQGTNIAITSLGCLFPCSFCIAGEQTRSYGNKVLFVPPKTIAEDLKRRSEKRIYLIDLNFSNYTNEALEALALELESQKINKEFIIEIRLDGLSRERMELLKRIGVKCLKIGIEGVSSAMFDEFKKKHVVAKMQEKVDLIREYKMDWIAYLLVGGATSLEDYDETIRVVEDLKPDNVIVSIWAYKLGTDYKYDTHHSPLRLKEWGLPTEVFKKLLKLQSKVNSTVGTIFN